MRVSRADGSRGCSPWRLSGAGPSHGLAGQSGHQQATQPKPGAERQHQVSGCRGMLRHRVGSGRPCPRIRVPERGRRGRNAPLTWPWETQAPLPPHPVDQTTRDSPDTRGEESVPPLDGEVSRPFCRRACRPGERLCLTSENAIHHSVEICANLYDRTHRNA